MKAVIKDIVKEMHTRDSGETPVIVYDVDYVHDSGEPNCSQRYAFTLDEVPPPDHFDKIAQSLQTDIDVNVERKAEAERLTAIHKPVDDKISELRGHFKLAFHENIPINDKK